MEERTDKRAKRSMLIITVIVSILAVMFVLVIIYGWVNMGLYDEQMSLDNAAIDEETGAFAVTWSDFKLIYVRVYDVNGDKLFYLTFRITDTGGGTTYLYFKDGFLHTQFVRNNVENVYDMNGVLKDTFICDSDSIVDWWGQFKQTFEKDNSLQTATINGTTYQYKRTRIFSSVKGVQKIFLIKNETIGEKIVWDSKWLK
ncbi:MAG: hypothetical protein J5832_04955 [Clostridia bacterium]|nr:hypothetical protein [Clostridia bacterium]